MNSKYKDKLVGVYAPGNYSGKFKLKKGEDVFDGFARWLEENEGIYNG